MPGPRPTPTNLKLLRGNPGQRRIRPEPQPEITAEVPSPPSWLDGIALEEWHKAAPSLHACGLLTKADTIHLALFCKALEHFLVATEKFKKMQASDPILGAYMVRTKNGTPIQNPLFLTARQSAADVLRLGTEFGMTPAARSRISSVEQPLPASKFGDLIAS